MLTQNNIQKIETVLVNGVVALENGKQVNVLPGELLKMNMQEKSIILIK